jgi:hypothetical protein
VRPSSLLVVAISAVAGVALGIGAGVAVDHGPTTFADPLRLGIPLRNQPCTDQVLLTVGRGSEPQLANVVAENPEQAVAYLQTRRSCPTTWTGIDRPAPEYVVYDGPFEKKADACDAQFSTGHRGGVVTTLTDHTTEAVHCLCYVRLARPVMRLDMPADGANGLWIRQLQSLLVDLGIGTEHEISGAYDLTTAAHIRTFQRNNRLPATGEVDPETWHLLLGRACAP